MEKVTQVSRTENTLGLHRAAETGDTKRIIDLISNGINVNFKHPDVDGETPLHHAARAGQLNAILILLENNADINVTDNVANTPLHLACEFGRHDAVRCLLDKGALVNAQSEYYGTPLHVAAYNQQEGIVYTLLANAADINAKEHTEKTPLQLSIDHKRRGMIKILSSLDELQKCEYKFRIYDFQAKLEVERRLLGSKVLGSEASQLSQLESLKLEVKMLKSNLVAQKIQFDNQLSSQKREFEKQLAKLKSEYQSSLLVISEMISKENAVLESKVFDLEDYRQLLSNRVSEEDDGNVYFVIGQMDETYSDTIETYGDSMQILEVLEDIVENVARTDVAP